jgi:hypothetical protein
MNNPRQTWNRLLAQAYKQNIIVILQPLEKVTRPVCFEVNKQRYIQINAFLPYSQRVFALSLGLNASSKSVTPNSGKKHSPSMRLLREGIS